MLNSFGVFVFLRHSRNPTEKKPGEENRERDERKQPKNTTDCVNFDDTHSQSYFTFIWIRRRKTPAFTQNHQHAHEEWTR